MTLAFPKNKINVLLLENTHPASVTAFKEEGFNVTHLAHSLSDDELGQALQGIHILGIRSKTQVTKAVLANAKSLWAVGAFCIGTNQIDLATCAEKGIAVFNAPFSNTRSVV
jgi:D-3-phosphoglycerate dehydrogenase / 2-oxoglutarate reductase